MIKERIYYDNFIGRIVEVSVGDFSTKIATYKNTPKRLVQLGLDTKPKIWLIDINKTFTSVSEAKKYYLDGLKISLEDHLHIMKKHNYKTKSLFKELEK